MKIWEFLEANGEKVWTKGAIARDNNGYATRVSDHSAKCFCALGLVNKFYGQHADDALRKFCSANGIQREVIVVWNDRQMRKFPSILKAFKKADL